MEKLNDLEVQAKLVEVPDWKLIDEKWIERKYRFLEFLNGVEFVQSVANVSEEANHHPFISIDYKVVTLKITSWHAKGLTLLDFEMARKFEDLFKQIKKG
ncbi:MAG: 4a-hydroxytetrahydrobiopterin dehydratase [Bacillota bacterium]|nr:4a-hydroxytetrahydrobiopterin dehydratase [Bacillota bacterium]